MNARVRTRDREKARRRGEEGHVPLVARDQPNGFRLTPHVARKPVHPFSRHPCQAAGTAAPKHARGNCYSIGSWISIPFVSSPFSMGSAATVRFALAASISLPPGQYLPCCFPPTVQKHFSTSVRKILGAQNVGGK